MFCWSNSSRPEPDNLESERDNLEPKCDNLESKCDNLESECDNLESECDNLESERDNLESERDWQPIVHFEFVLIKFNNYSNYSHRAQYNDERTTNYTFWKK